MERLSSSSSFLGGKGVFNVRLVKNPTLRSDGFHSSLKRLELIIYYLDFHFVDHIVAVLIEFEAGLKLAAKCAVNYIDDERMDFTH